MTALEWLEQQIKETYDKEGKLSIAYTLHLIKQAKEMEEKEKNCEYSGLPSVKSYEK